VFFAVGSSFSQMTRDHGRTGFGFTSLSNIRSVSCPTETASC
jgi:hypothetical protein